MTRKVAPAKGAAAMAAAPATASTRRGALTALERFAEEQRIIGAIRAYESFDGLLTEHLLALEEVRAALRLVAAAAMDWPGVSDAMRLLDREISHIRALAGASSEGGDEE